MPIIFDPVFCVLNGREFSIEQYANNTLNVSDDAIRVKSHANNLEDRVQSLLENFSHHIHGFDIQAPVCVLLPRVSCKSVLKRISSVILSLFNLEANPLIRFYPYGEASLLMALSQLEELSHQNTVPWIIAINLAQGSSSKFDVYDSLVVARCVAVKEGLNVRTQSIDLELTPLNTATDNIVRQLGNASEQSFDELLLSIGIEEEPQWLNSIHFLSSWISAETRYIFSDSRTGPLGACGGLLKALSLCHRQRVKHVENFQVLQVDIETQGYAIGTIFNWCSE
ncbi:MULTISPECIES: hypothetical protein [Vibrio harveyi group]|uniref:NAD/NADP transhydrogenase subunit beta n=1 Tax=Vibrio jasicida TaxID=766224 RepID=A0ABW7JA76_9VIBR|nr:MULTISPECIES: hypothetical protein [Vibrio harveyi group]NOJ19667.1 hypothetical protein [Vibrio jasicida]PAW07942.1 hypothetical protein B6K85_24845 [Vibrio sp. V1B]